MALKVYPANNQEKDTFTVFCDPEPGTRYAVGVDGATGIGQDYTSIQVWSRRIPFEQVACLRSRTITTVEGSRAMVDIAEWFNHAMLVIETRHPGNAYQDNAIEVYGYNNLYKREQRLDENPHVSSKFGICTSEADKNLLVNETRALIENPDGPQVIFHDLITLEEFCNFVYIEDKSKMGAAEGVFDDTVMGTMLALHACILWPQAARKVKAKAVKRLNEDEAHKQHLMGLLLGRKKEQGVIRT